MAATTTLYRWANSRVGGTVPWRWLAAYLFIWTVGLLGDFASCGLDGLPHFWAQVVPQLHYLAIIFAARRFGVLGGLVAACIAGASHVAMLAGACTQTTSEGGHLAMFAAVGLIAGWLSERRVTAFDQEAKPATLAAGEHGSNVVLSQMGYLTPELVHQFLTPIASIEGAGFVLEDSDLADDKRQEFVGIIRTECRRLELLVELLDLSQTRGSEYQDVSISRLLDEVIRQCESKPETRITFRNTTGQVAFLRCKPELIKHAIQVLITIAIQAIAQSGQVELSANPNGRETVIRVEGRPDRFCPAPDPAMLYNRNAVDLAVVQQISNRQGGAVRMEIGNHGSISFLMVLPR